MASLRLLPAVGREEEVYCMVIHFCFALEIAVNHLAYWGGSIYADS
jgi:hypothetical protein